MLTGWCDDLDPPGLALGPMAPNWNGYFDHYLEGKTVAPPTRADAAGAKTDSTWQARGGALSENSGILSFTPDPDGKGRGFLTRSDLKLAGPVTARLELKASPGTGAITWRSRDDKDFLPENRFEFEVAASDDWQTLELVLPAKGRVVHLRVQLPKGPAQFRSLDFKSTRK